MNYPTPDRSGYIPQFSKNENNEAIDLYYGETKLSDSRILRCEIYCLYQLTMVSYFFSTVGIANFTAIEIRDLLVREKIIEFSDEENARLSCEKINDYSNNEMWEIKIIIGDEDNVFVKSTSAINLQTYVKPTDEKLDISEAMEFEKFEIVFNSLPTILKLGSFEIKDLSELYKTTKEIKVWEEYKESVLSFLDMFYTSDYSPYTKEGILRIIRESYINDEEDFYLEENDLLMKYAVDVHSLINKSITRLEHLWSMYGTTWNAEDENKSMFFTVLYSNYFVDAEGINEIKLLLKDCFAMNNDYKS